jgi:hypothetical protein
MRSWRRWRGCLRWQAWSCCRSSRRVAVLLAFKWTADQPALAAAKQAMHAAIFEMRLFNDDLVLLFRAQGEVVRHSLTYLRLSLAPTLWLIVPWAC